MVRIDYIPENAPSRERSGRLRTEKNSITIHNTGNPRSTAKNERDFASRRTDSASFHYVLDDKEVIAVLPEEEMSYHSGTAAGNRNSISIEICESGDWDTTWDLAVKFVASLLDKRGWGIDRLRTHQSWSGKECPRLILPHWHKFVEDIQNTLGHGRNESPKVDRIPQETVLKLILKNLQEQDKSSFQEFRSDRFSFLTQTLLRQIQVESSFNRLAVSPTGAQGLAQFISQSWEEWGNGGDPFNIEDSISAQIRYMTFLYSRFGEIPDRNERLKFALASYNAGRTNVNRALSLSRKSDGHPASYATWKNKGEKGGIWQKWWYTVTFLEKTVGRDKFIEVGNYVNKIWVV